MNVLYVVLLCLAFSAIQVLIGGTRLLFALPAYGVLAVAALASLVHLRRSRLPPNGWCLGSAALFFGYVLARGAFSPVAYLAWQNTFMVLGALMVYLLTACYLTDPRRRMWILAGWLFLVAGNLVVGLRQFLGDDKTTVFGFLRSAQYGGRASGFYICPDHLAGFLEIVICLSIAVLIWARVRPWVRLLLGYMILCSLALLAITGSRGGYLSMGVGLFVLVILGLQRTRITSPEWFGRALLLIFALGLLLATIGAYAFSHHALLASRVNNVVDTRDIRLQIWPAAVREFQESPAFGTGSGTFLYYGRRFRDPRVQTDPIHTHNDYLQLLGEYGVAGAVGLLIFLGAHLRWGWLVYRRFCLRSAGQGEGGGSNAVAWNLGALAAVACLAAHSVVDFNLHIPANALVLAFVFGVLANPGRSFEAGGETAPVSSRAVELLPRLALPALGLVVLAWGLPKLPGEWYAEQARVALRDHHSAAALDLARQGIERETSNPWLYNYRGQARMEIAGTGADTLISRSFREAAVQDFEAAVCLAPMDTTLLGRLGEAYTRVNAFEQAAQTFDQALFWDGNSVWVLIYDGFYLQQRGLYPQARAAYGRALSLNGSPVAAAHLEAIARSGVVPNATVGESR